ncbi:hypothetical protein MM26B8_03850 [Mycoplasmopsis meleagridis]|uniref:Lipoprotein n=1 Tax=Mycoplasmopsis meleagridis ATCC 25294 TaxID=1264554 RepID=A0A0F5H0J1_9BACT|nr:hypothetical protein [Mycoplasmopsis meleagridis]KKB26799.1 hypothetical protein MMELEA_01900 [Mycoplasmopsis meleagridis ATCC 25294]OAD18084.1 hypothetical protein MM26B8_03850 [Mycoplasmopsis meleagridis]VEU77334.1 Uncharacterised protein [Mycoplasmopsis meleagridis]
MKAKLKFFLPIITIVFPLISFSCTNSEQKNLRNASDEEKNNYANMQIEALNKELTRIKNEVDSSISNSINIDNFFNSQLHVNVQKFISSSWKEKINLIDDFYKQIPSYLETIEKYKPILSIVLANNEWLNSLIDDYVEQLKDLTKNKSNDDIDDFNSFINFSRKSMEIFEKYFKENKEKIQKLFDSYGEIVDNIFK